MVSIGLPAADGVLVEREAELSRIRRVALEALAGRSSVIEIAGPPGGGCGALVQATMTQARQAGFQVLFAKGSRAEADLNQGIVSQFLAAFDPLLPAVACSPPMRLCSAFLAAASDRPLMLALDEAQWSDEYSLQWLSAMLRRSQDARLLIVLARSRPQLLFETTMAELRVNALASGMGWHVLRSGPLSATGTRQMLEDACPMPADDVFVEAALLHTRGLPVLLRRLADAIGRADFLPTAKHLPALDTWAADEVAAWHDSVVRTLPSEELTLLRVIVVCGEGYASDLVAALAGLRTATVTRAVELFRSRGLLADGDPPRPSCPVLAARVLAHMTSQEREELCARAAVLGHRAAVAVETLARIMLWALVIGEPWAVPVLCDAAERSSAEGRPEQALRYLNRALDEPMDDVNRARLQVGIASLEVLSRSPEASDRRLARVVPGRGPQQLGPVRLDAADALLARGSTGKARRAIAAALTLPNLADGDRAGLIAQYWIAMDVPDESHLPMASPAPALPDLPTDPARSAALAWQVAARGLDLTRTRALARAALAVPAERNGPLYPRLIACRALLITDDVAEAETGLDEVLLEARRRDARTVLARARLVWANVCIRQGRLTDAAANLERALGELPLRCWHPTAQPAVLASQMDLHLESGMLASAERLAAAELPSGGEHSLGWSLLLFAKGRLRLRTGQPRVAVEHFQEAGRQLLARQWVTPAFLAWRSFAAMAHHACGNAEEAERLITEQRGLAEIWGSPTVLGSAHLRASVILTGAARLESLEAAVEVLRESPSRMRYAEALIRLASARHEAGDTEAVARLAAEAGELAWSHGAHDLTGRARELGWNPGRADRPPPVEAVRVTPLTGSGTGPRQE